MGASVPIRVSSVTGVGMARKKQLLRLERDAWSLLKNASKETNT